MICAMGAISILGFIVWAQMGLPFCEKGVIKSQSSREQKAQGSCRNSGKDMTMSSASQKTVMVSRKQGEANVIDCNRNFPAVKRCIVDFTHNTPLALYGQRD
jgi:hypothetical protein